MDELFLAKLGQRYLNERAAQLYFMHPDQSFKVVGPGQFKAPAMLKDWRNLEPEAKRRWVEEAKAQIERENQ